MRPRVFVDCRWVGHTGLGRYVDSMMAELVRLDHGLTIIPGVRRDEVPQPEWCMADHVEPLDVEAPWFSGREQIELPIRMRRARLDLAHFTNFNVPLAYSGPFVATVHDLTLIDQPTAGPSRIDRARYRAKLIAMRTVLRRTVRGARSVLVPSEYVGEQIRRRFGVQPDRVRVTPEAPTGFDRLDHDGVAALGVTAPFVLSIGKAYPHKNLSRLLEAFELLDLATFTPTLLLVGPEDAHRQSIRDEVVRRGLGQRVAVHGHVDDATLGALFASAGAYVFPSMSEGFGLPGLEAMAAGLPVASSTATCLPEVFGDAAAYFDPTDPAAIAETLRRVNDDDELRRELVDAGHRRAATFSWRRTAEQTLDAYHEALGNKG